MIKIISNKHIELFCSFEKGKRPRQKMSYNIKIFIALMSVCALHIQAGAQCKMPPTYPPGTVCVNGMLQQLPAATTVRKKKGELKYSCVSFYVVAHQDDWQLFMGSQAWADVQSYDAAESMVNGSKVVFIYITDGAFHSEPSDNNSCFLCLYNENDPQFSSFCGEDNHYSVVRERAAESSLRVAANRPDGTLSGRSYNNNFSAWYEAINHHSVWCVRYRNTVSYYIRLSTFSLIKWFYGFDGKGIKDSTGNADKIYPFKPANVKKEGQSFMSDYDFGFFWCKDQLSPCSKVFFDSTASGRRTNYDRPGDEFDGKHDLINTLSGIYFHELIETGDVLYNRTAWLNIQDPNLGNDYNKNDHREHTASALIAFNASRVLSQKLGDYFKSDEPIPVPVNLWIDYNIAKRPVNLNASDIESKSVLIGAYEAQLVKDKSYIEIDAWHQFVNRSYNRLIFNSDSYIDWIWDWSY